MRGRYHCSRLSVNKKRLCVTIEAVGPPGRDLAQGRAVRVQPGGMNLEGCLARVPDHREFLTLDELRARARALIADFPGLARLETVGTSTEGRPIELHDRAWQPAGAARRCAAPERADRHAHDDFLTGCREDDALRARLDVTLFAVPVADPDGFVLNEGWFKDAFSPLRYALEFYRPPHREQVEWSFPVDYKTLQFTTPTSETATVMRVMERVRPRVFYSLHNAGFCGVYFYVSHHRPALFRRFHDLVAGQGLPLHRGEPEVPYLKTLAPAVYELFSIRDTYDYLARTVDADPAAVIEAGTCADDWLQQVCDDAFSLVCELPYYTAPALADATTADDRRAAPGARAGSWHWWRRAPRSSTRSRAACPTTGWRARCATTSPRRPRASPPSAPMRRHPNTTASPPAPRSWTRPCAASSITRSTSARCTGWRRWFAPPPWPTRSTAARDPGRRGRVSELTASAAAPSARRRAGGRRALADGDADT
jgi:hypothetical protein